jgi:integrase
MHLFFTQSEFEYTHPIFKNKIITNNSIPFFIDKNGKLVELVNKYLLCKCEQQWRNKENTIKTNYQNIYSFLKYIDNNMILIEKVSFDVVDSYLEHLQHKNLKESTIKQKISSINAFYSWALKYSFIKKNPFEMFSNNYFTRKINTFSKSNTKKTFNINSVKNKIVTDLKTEDIPTEIELKALYKSLPEEYKLIMLVYLNTGMRKTELLQLTPQMILDAKDNGNGFSYSLILDANKINIKNMKSRVVVLDGFIRNKIIKHLKNKEYKKRAKIFSKKHSAETPAFISKQGNFYASNTLNSNFKKLNKGGFNITIHSLRHYYATHFIRYKERQGECTEGAYMYLSERLGHSSVDTTKEYYVKIINKLKEQKSLEYYSANLIQSILND